MPHSQQLTAAEVMHCRLSYEAGETFEAIAGRFGMDAATIYGLLSAVGVESRRRGQQVIEITTPDLVLADWRAGLSCRAIAAKHGLTSHHCVGRFLRSHGIDVRGRPARRKIPGVVLGSAVTNHQAYLRQRPPLEIPMRTGAERLLKAWTPAELSAIEYELAAGRFQVVPRGAFGLSERRSLYEIQRARQQLRPAA
jgi:hypothetical protein